MYNRRVSAAPPVSGRSARFQPDYRDEVCEKDLEDLRRRVDERKPDGFTLTPITEPGW